MKKMKKAISLVSALLLMLALVPAAYADRTVERDLGTVSVGQDVELYIADIEQNAEIGSVVMPDGCSIRIDVVENVPKLYLFGNIKSTGSIQFTLPVVTEEESYNICCTLRVISVAPSVSASADIECKLGDSALISVSASANDGGTLSYQWFSASTGRIDGATESSYRPNTFLTGTQHYYCEVTSTVGSMRTTTSSGYISVTVAPARELTGIEILSLPLQLKYRVGDSVDTYGLTLVAKYSDGTTERLDNGYEISPFFFMNNGRQTVEIRYQGMLARFEVTVGEEEQLVDRLEVLERPDRNLYKVGEILNTSGLIVRAYLADGSSIIPELSKLEFSPTRLNNAGEQRVTVKFGEKTCTFTVNVEEDKTEIALISAPSRTEYTVGDRLDTTGLSISVKTGSRTETVTSGFSCTPKVLTTAGRQEITVIYGGVNTCSFYVNVKEKEIKVSPTPNVPAATARPTEAPAVKPAPSAVPTPVRHESHATNIAGTLMKVILVIAIFSLVGLGAYVVIMRKKGKK